MTDIASSTLLDRLRAYPDHPDPRTESCNWIALIVASNQPIYPFYLLWLVGGDWWVAAWTFLSTPFFLAVPAVARRNAAAGRALLPLAGIGNGIVSAKAFGTLSGVELFLIPCTLIVLLAFRRIEWRWVAGLCAVVLLVIRLHGHYGTPFGRFDAREYAAFFRINLYSVAGLSCVILWSLGRARLREQRSAGTAA